MSASNQGSEGVSVEAETRDGSNSTDHTSGMKTEVPIVVSSESSKVAPSSGGGSNQIKSNQIKLYLKSAMYI